MEEVTDRRDSLTREDVRRRRAFGTQPDPSPGELAIDRAHLAVECQAPRSGFGRPEVFHVIGSTTRFMMLRRLIHSADRGVGAVRYTVRVDEPPNHRSSVMLFCDASGASVGYVDRPTGARRASRRPCFAIDRDAPRFDVHVRCFDASQRVRARAAPATLPFSSHTRSASVSAASPSGIRPETPMTWARLVKASA